MLNYCYYILFFNKQIKNIYDTDKYKNCSYKHIS